MKTKIANRNILMNALGLLSAYVLVMLLVLFCVSSCKRLDNKQNIEHGLGKMGFTASLSNATTTAIVSDVDCATKGVFVSGCNTTKKMADVGASDKSKVFPSVFDYNPGDDQLPVLLNKL